MDKEPAELKVTRPARNVRRERVALWELDGGHVSEHEVAAFGVRILMKVSN